MQPGPKWEDVRRELGELFDLPPELRNEHLARLDPALRREIESLLAAHEDTPPFLNLPEERAQPRAIGPYRIVDELGRGGMGVVFRAERADGELHRRVAIKLAGGRMFAPEAERRFIRERQILASLEHPHIVRLIDGGVADGQRYLVMELLDGVPITEYTREKPLAERVRLLIDVCSAIHYAHQRLVLHRDLKPSNVIVTRDGLVKILDFGIAQLLHDDGSATAVHSTVIHPLSIACASPEQLRGEPLSLASDIYSLGMLIYEVVAGVNPRYRAGGSFDENLRRSLEEDVPPPSRVDRSIPRDLDAIVLKALAKRSQDRYGSAGELQADLERFLEGRPVHAVPPRTGYLLRRYIARNKALTAAAMLVLATGLVAAASYVRQNQIEQRRFEDARRLIRAVVFDIQPQLEAIPATLPLRKKLIEETMAYLEAVSRDVGNNVSLLRDLASSYAQLAVVQGDAMVSNLGNREAAATLFARAAELMDRALMLAPDDPDVIREAASLNQRRADFNLMGDDRPGAIQLAKTAAELADRSVAMASSAPAEEARALAWMSLGRALLGEDLSASIEHFLRARAFFEETRNDATPRRESVQIEIYLAEAYSRQPDADRARHHAREAYRLANEVLIARPQNQAAQFDVVVSTGQLAAILYNTGDETGAVEYFRLSAEARERMAAADPENVVLRERLAMAKGRLGTILARAGDFKGADVLLKEALAIYEGLQKSGQLAPNLEPDFAEVIGHIADYHSRLLNLKEACAAWTRAAAMLKAADARAPLSGQRKAMLDYNLAEAAKCR